MEILGYIFIGLCVVVALVFWGCLPSKDEPDANPYS